MRVAVMGTGHVGLVTCVTFAEIGHDVVGTDIDVEKVGLLQRGVPPFFEPGLEATMDRVARSGKLRFEADPSSALRDADVVFVCVGTPARANGDANLLAMEDAASQIARYARDGAVVVEKSTVPAGTADRVRTTLQRHGGDRSFDVASNPEFLREGSAMQDALRPDRIVIGIESARALDVLRRLYAPLLEAGVPLIVTDIRTAELAKHASNAFLALKISFANALARICERADADVTAVADVMGSDPRIGRAFLDAGLGYGGYCFPKDVAALHRLAERLGYPFPLLREVERINDEAIDATMTRIEDALWNLEGKRIAVLGLAFKPGTDDVRFSPALTLVRRLLTAGADAVGFDPHAATTAKDELPELELASTAYGAATGAHALVIATDWPEFARLDPNELRRVMAHPLVIDARNLLDPSQMAEAGFWYYPIGRPAVAPEVVGSDRSGGPAATLERSAPR
ncbi:MAG TPA: UDP-glucose/GDP-mannose dehydrogenase family protein [Actinomycetota bacterium]|nr:UDP-glucose/GDP-mannose dehydrogenase family protein [Actinomycetota bacterium]